MATPTYQGLQRVNAGSSWFGSWLNSTPVYAGGGQSAQPASMFGSSVPAYKPAPTNPAVADPQSVTSEDSDACAPTAFAIVVPR